MGGKLRDGSTVNITERWLEATSSRPDLARVQLWDQRLSGFGVVVGRSPRSFVAAHLREGQARQALRHARALGAEQAHAADAGLRDRTMTVAKARSAAINGSAPCAAARTPPPRSRPGPPSARRSRCTSIGYAARAAARAASTPSSARRRSTSPSWTGRRLADITRTDCARSLHERLTGSSGPYLANRLMRYVRASLEHGRAQEHDLPVEPRDRGALEQGAPAPGADPVGEPPRLARGDRRALRCGATTQLVVLLTGLRRKDAATIRWDHVDFEARTLRRPNPKGGADRAFTIPLSRACLEILERRRAEQP